MPATNSASLCWLVIYLAGLSQTHPQPADEPTFGLEKRIPWTTSRVVGSPDPPLPYTVEKTFAKIKLRSPIYAAAEPDTDRLLVIEQGGEKDRPSRILRVRDDAGTERIETLL